MKILQNKFINKIAATILLASSTILGNAQSVTLNCESAAPYYQRNTTNNIAYDRANCWVFGAFSYIRSTVSLPSIAGTFSAYSNSMTNGNANNSGWIKSPWIKMGSGNIIMKVRMEGTSGTGGVVGSANYKAVRIRIVTYNPSALSSSKESDFLADSFTYLIASPYTNVQNISFAVPSAIVGNNNVYKIMFSFIGAGGNNRAIADDIVIPGTYWSNPSNSCLPLALIVDADNDGVQDSDDAYPNDASKAYNNYYPSSNTYGTLMFEDLWPSTGDYDFNDLVLGYRYNRITNADNKVVEISATYITKAVGATMHNGFGLQLNGVTSAKVTSVTGAKSNGVNWLTLSGNGTESGQTYANIVVFDDALRIMPNQGGSCINTYSENPFVTPDTTTLTISLTTATGQALSISDIVFNPYLIINQTRNKELHLANFAPTDKASSEYFGTVQDNTTSASSSYKSKVNNLPWALDVPASIPYMKEKVDFITGYLNFANWAISNGSSNTDWYQNNTGNRDSSKLY